MVSGSQLKKGFNMSCSRTWIDLAVAGHSVGIYNVLETSCKGVDGKQGGWGCGGRQTVVERIHPTAALSLVTEKKEEQQDVSVPQ